MSPLLRSRLATNQDRICSHSPSKGSLWVRRQPSTRFLRSCWRYKDSSPAAGLGKPPSLGSFPAVHCSTEKTWRGSERGDEIKGEQPTAQRKTACCNCSKTSSSIKLSHALLPRKQIKVIAYIPLVVDCAASKHLMHPVIEMRLVLLTRCT